MIIVKKRHRFESSGKYFKQKKKIKIKHLHYIYYNGYY